MITAGMYFCKAARTGADEFLVRTPELGPLRGCRIGVFGLGCLGAMSTLEFVRAGVEEVRILDHDFVNPATSARWPFGVSAAGRAKVDVLTEFIKLNYPSTRVHPVLHVLGAIHDEPEPKTDQMAVAEMTINASMIYDATAEIGVHDYLASIARAQQIPYLAVSGTYGGWGGKIVRIVPGRTEGCWQCACHALHDGTIPEPPSDPNGEVQPRGCGDITFTGAGFDMAEIAINGVRAAVSILCGGTPGAYPLSEWDIMTIAFRTDAGQLISPQFEQFKLKQHSKCELCTNT